MCREAGAHSPQLHRSARSAAGEQGPEEELQQPAGQVGWEAGPVTTMTHPSTGLMPLLTQAPRKPLPKFRIPTWIPTCRVGALVAAARGRAPGAPAGSAGAAGAGPRLGGRTACGNLSLLLLRGLTASTSSAASASAAEALGWPFILGQAPAPSPAPNQHKPRP